MTTFEITMIILAIVAQLGAFIAAYIKLKTDIAKVQGELEQMQDNRNEFIINLAAKVDKELLLQVQKELNSKLDTMNAQVNLIVQTLIK